MFTKKINTKTDDFKFVLDTIKNFLEEPFQATVENAEYSRHWFADGNKWE